MRFLVAFFVDKMGQIKVIKITLLFLWLPLMSNSLQKMKTITQLTFTNSKLRIKTLEQGVK